MTHFIQRIMLRIYRKRWLLSRRMVQSFILLAFLVHLPEIGQIAVGNLSSSEWFGRWSLTDPFILLQSFLSGGVIAKPALIGAVVVAGFYIVFGGRIYCSWVCPINLMTDAAYWLRQRLNIKNNLTLSRTLRKAILVLALLLCFMSGTLVWETVNPITLLQRELMWASLTGSMLLLTLFLFDMLVSRRGWCGHLCPVGAFYGVIGRFGRLRITVNQKRTCAGAACSACIKVCPEPHVLAPVISQVESSVVSQDCTRCGACLDSCQTDALKMTFAVRNTRIPIVVEKNKR